MSFGGQSNAWQRSMMQGHPQSNSFHQGPPQMFMQTPQQNNMAAFGHGGGGGGGMYPNSGAGGSVSYPQPRTGLNPVAFQGSGGGGGGGIAQTQYNSIGTVTKINNDCGLVNNEVFFYRNVCKGPEPKLGDRVIFEATYSTSGQFKWNATRIQLMQPNPQPIINSTKSNYASVAPPNEYQRAAQMQRHPSPKRVLSPLRGVVSGIRHEPHRRERERERDHHHRSRDRDDDEHDRKRRRDDHDRSRDRNNSNIRASGSSNAVVPSRNDREREREREPRRERDIPERDREREQREREREREQREREREREKEKEKEKEKDKDKEREREKPRDVERSVVPKGRRKRGIRRYMIQIPKYLLSHKNADVQELRNRYTTLYIPSDFFHANMKWTETFTPDNSFSLRRPCQFHIMHKLVEPPYEQKMDDLEPVDADYVYSAKVMLMALPPIAEIYKKCFEANDEDLDHHPTHPSRLINFLVGIRGRNEPLAIGGPWSPSLDGENPDTDPSVLIRTAIRTCKALTGIDLSNCTQWYRFVELYYHRTEYKNMEKDGPPRVETVVIYLPDVHSCMPTVKEYETLCELYKTSADNVIARRAAAFNKAVAASTNEDNNESTNAEGDNAEEANDTAAEETEQNEDGGANVDAEGDGGGDGANADDDVDNAEEEGDGNNASEAVGNDENGDQDEQMDNSGAAAEADVVMDQNADNTHDAADENEEPSPEPTHYTLLDLKTMKVQEIRDELLARDLPDKGVRNVVMARLAKALTTEKAEEMKAKNREILQKLKQQKKLAAGDAANKKAEEKGGPKSKKKAVKNSDKDESKDDWADAIDFELSDIVILDEYDASKNPEDKEMTEKEKNQLIRRYTLPPNPQIVVHPNKLAKGGNFDCAVMSLSVLLDYHPEDTKERFFEVSLFAELFNEMLTRDFAFTIYKEIYVHKEKESSAEGNGDGGDVKLETSQTEEANGDEKPAKELESGEPPSKIRKRRMSTVDGRERERENGGEKKAPPKRRMSTYDGRERDQLSSDDKKVVPAKPQRRMSTVDGREDDTTSNEPGKKMVVVKPQLLLSFLYFDTQHCGYIFERDLEDLFAVLGLNLSRSQIKKVLGKLATRQSIYYRKLTDKEETEECTPCIEDIDELPVDELRDIASGNNKYEFVFGESHATHCVVPIDGDDNNDGDLINYNGTVIHVGKLMHQIKRTEKNYSDLEKLYNDLLKQHDSLKRKHNRSSSKLKDLQSDTESLSRKLTDTNQDLYSLNRKYRDQNSTLSYIYTRVSPYFIREKDKEKDSKTESSHKDKDEKKKDDDKSKDKESTSEKDKEKNSEKHKEKDKGKDKDKESDKEKAKEGEKDKLKDKDDRAQNKGKEVEKRKSTETDKEKEKPKENNKPKETEKEKVTSKDAEKEKDTFKETEQEMDTSEEKETCEEKETNVSNTQTDNGGNNKGGEKKETPPKEPVKVEEKEKPKGGQAETPKEAPKPAQATVAKATPAKATPAKVVPAKATPAKAVPAKTTPGKGTPAKAVPAKAVPAKATPAKATPAAKTTAAPGKAATSTPAKATPGKVNPAAKKPVATVVKKVAATTENSQK